MPANEEVNVQRDWNFGINLSGLQAPTGKGGQDLPEGYYKALITDMYINPDKNANRVIIKAKVSEGPFAGVIRTDGLGIPKGEDDNVRYYWRGLAESVGYGPKELDNGGIELGVGAFKDRTGHMYYMPKDEEAGRQYDSVAWLAPAEWAQQKQNFDLVAAKEQSKPKAAVGGTGSALGGGATPPVEKAQPLGGGNSGGGNALGATPAGDAAPAEGGTTKSALLKQLGVT